MKTRINWTPVYTCLGLISFSSLAWYLFYRAVMAIVR